MAWRSIGDVSAGIIARWRRGETITAVDKIATLASREEIAGYRDQVARSGRAWESGEQHALLERERELR